MKEEKCTCKIIAHGRLIEVCVMHYQRMMEDVPIKWGCVLDWPTAEMFGIPIVFTK